MGNFGGRKFWQTIQVKAIGEENLANKLQSVYMPNTFLVGLSNSGKITITTEL